MRYSDEKIIEGIADGVLVLDPETGQILDANSTYLEMHAYDRSAIAGQTVEAVTAEDPQSSPETAMERIKQARRDGDMQFEWRSKRATGETFPVEVNLSVEKNVSLRLSVTSPSEKSTKSEDEPTSAILRRS